MSNLSCSLTRNITSLSMKNLAFHSLLRWKITILSILTTSLIHFSLEGWENCAPLQCLKLAFPSLAPGSVPTVTVASGSLKVLEGEETVFQCTATGEPRPAITWSRPGGQLPQASVLSNGQLRIYPTQTGDEGTYRCVASNSFGDAQILVNLTVEEG